MKLSQSLSLLVCAVMLFFTSCVKSDFVSADESVSQSVDQDATAADISKCKIRRIYQGPDDNPYTYSALFSYNKAGNPYSILRSPGGGGSDFRFYYDSRNRLNKLEEYAYGITWRHYYRHNAAGQIVIDSAVNPGSDGKDTTIFVSAIQYDSKGRVVKETIVNTRNDGWSLAPTRRPTYTYDLRGNLGVIGWKSSSYDYKVNPLRLNPVWQFITRNYSMNNPQVQARYNSFGLPLSLTTNDNFFDWLGATKIIYECQ